MEGQYRLDLCNLGVATRLTGDPVQAVPLLEAGRALASEIGLTYVASTVIMCLADALRELRKTSRAQSLYRDGLRLAIEQGERRNQAIAISGLAAPSRRTGVTARPRLVSVDRRTPCSIRSERP